MKYWDFVLTAVNQVLLQYQSTFDDHAVSQESIIGSCQSKTGAILCNISKILCDKRSCRRKDLISLASFFDRFNWRVVGRNCNLANAVKWNCNQWSRGSYAKIVILVFPKLSKRGIKDIPAKLNNPKPLLKIKQTFQIKSRKVTHINAVCQVKLYFDNKFGQVALHDSKCLQ